MTAPLLADHVALDFVGTLSERTSKRVESLATPADLDRWLVRAGVVESAPGATAADLRAAVEVREAIHAVLRAVTEQRPLPRAAVSLLNRTAARPTVVPRLTTSGRILRHGDVPAALAVIATATLDLLGGDDLSRLRWCADDTCTHPFLDRSRAGRRRWCGMTGCGDRAKARAYRARQKAGSAATPEGMA